MISSPSHVPSPPPLLLYLGHMEWSVGGHLAFGWGSAGVGRGVLEMGSIHICGEREEVGQIPVRETMAFLTGHFSSSIWAALPPLLLDQWVLNLSLDQTHLGL